MQLKNSPKTLDLLHKISSQIKLQKDVSSHEVKYALFTELIKEYKKEVQKGDFGKLFETLKQIVSSEISSAFCKKYGEQTAGIFS